MIIYNNNDYGPALDKDGNPEKEKTYKQILDDIHSRKVKALRSDDESNAQIIHKNS